MKYNHYIVILLFFLTISGFSAHRVYAASKHTYEVNTDFLTIRRLPSEASEIVGTLRRGNKVTTFKEHNGWVQTYYNGQEAWAVANYLKPTQESNVFLPNGLLSGYTIVIDPGHGGKDPGAIGSNGVLEKDLILATSLAIAKQLEEAGAEVILTRKDDSFLTLDERVAISNENHADAFISIHFNSYDQQYVGGINTYYHKKGKRLAYAIQRALSQEVKLRNRGVIQNDYHVLRDNHQPAILIELGFITNTKELTTLQSEGYQSNVARAILIGLIEYFW